MIKRLFSLVFSLFLNFLGSRWNVIWWTGKDSNLRTRERADLQSAAINHSATCPEAHTEAREVRNLDANVNGFRWFLPCFG